MRPCVFFLLWLTLCTVFVGAAAAEKRGLRTARPNAAESEKPPSRTGKTIALQQDAPPQFHAGPLVDAHRRPLDGAAETEVIGPLLQWARTDRLGEFGLRPIFFWSKDRAIDHARWQLGYPLLTYTRHAGEGRTQFVQLLSWAAGTTPQDDSKTAKRFTLFPILFAQSSPIPHESYFALFPLGGTIRNRVGFRRADFVLFPLWAQTVRRGDVATMYAPWPIVQIPVGEGAHGFGFWPLLGHRRQDGQFYRGFALWPLVHYLGQDLSGENPRHVVFVFPFWASSRSPNADFTSSPWPLFTRIHDKKDNYREIGFPWPLVAFGSGDTRQTQRVWPFYGKQTRADGERRFLLWPLWQQSRQEFKNDKDLPGFLATNAERTRNRALLILFSDTRLKVEGAPAEQRRVDFWPLFTWSRDNEGNTEFQTLSVLAPILPGNEGVTANYEPLWGLARWEKAAGGDCAFSLLWNTLRYESGKQSRKFSILAGLFQYQRTAGHRQVRLFYGLRFSRKTPLTEAAE